MAYLEGILSGDEFTFFKAARSRIRSFYDNMECTEDANNCKNESKQSDISIIGLMPSNH